VMICRHSDRQTDTQSVLYMMIMSFLQYADGASGLEQNSLYKFLFYRHFIVLWLFAVCLYLKVCSVVILTIGAAEGRQRGKLPSPRWPKIHFNIKMCQYFLYPETCSRGLQWPFRGQKCPSPKSSSPPRQISGYTYMILTS